MARVGRGEEIRNPKSQGRAKSEIRIIHHERPELQRVAWVGRERGNRGTR